MRWTFFHVKTGMGYEHYTVHPGIVAKEEVEIFLEAWLGEDAEYVIEWHVEYTPEWD